MSAYETFFLPVAKDHQWKVKSGHKALVAGSGAVRLDFPRTWIFEPGPTAARIYDRRPPREQGRIQMSYSYLPPCAWDMFPLQPTVENMLRAYPDALGISPVHTLYRLGWRLVWGEVHRLDSQDGRPLRCRTAVALGTTVVVLLSFDFYESERPRMEPVWDTLLETLDIGKCIPDPTTGAVINPMLQ